MRIQKNEDKRLL